MPSMRPLQRSAHYRSLLGSCKRLALMTRNAGNSSVYARAAHAINTLAECDPVRSCSHDMDRTPRSLFALAFQRANCRPRNEYKGRRRQKAECRARNAQTNEQSKEISRRQPPSERCCATPVLKLLADARRALVTRSLVSERATTGIVASSQVELPTRGPSEKGEGGHQKCARFQRRPSYDGPNSAAK